MIFTIFIAPHERAEAIEAYRERLTEAQIATILDAPESATIQFSFCTVNGTATIQIHED